MPSLGTLRAAGPCPRGSPCPRRVMLRGRRTRHGRGTRDSAGQSEPLGRQAGFPQQEPHGRGDRHSGECQTHSVHLLPRRGSLLGSGQPRPPERKGSRRESSFSPQPHPPEQHPLSHPRPLGSGHPSTAPHPSPAGACPAAFPSPRPYLVPCSSPGGAQALASGAGSPWAVRQQAAACMVAGDAVPSDTAEPWWGHIYSSASAVTHKFFGAGERGDGAVGTAV